MKNAIRRHDRKHAKRSGMTAVLAMMFLTMATTLGLAMYAASTTTTASAANLLEADRARGAAESGLRWAAWRFVKMTRPHTTTGSHNPDEAMSLEDFAVGTRALLALLTNFPL